MSSSKIRQRGEAECGVKRNFLLGKLLVVFEWNEILSLETLVEDTLCSRGLEKNDNSHIKVVLPLLGEKSISRKHEL